MVDFVHGRILNFIDGVWRSSEGSRVVDNVNPANTRSILGDVVDSDLSDVDEAVESANLAFFDWKKVPSPRRADMLLDAMRIMTQRKEALARALTLEEGKTYAESLGEVGKAINVLEFVAGEGLRNYGTTAPSELPRNFAYTIRVPLGVVGLITPWNFPVCIPVWKIAPAIVSGNTVVLKPSPLTPWTAKMIVEIFVDAGIPEGVINLVHGGASVGMRLVAHPDVKAVSFTGSNKIGAEVYQLAAQHMKRAQCEMGGKNPVIVMDDADLDLAAAATVQGAFGSTGQRCTATSRAIVFESVADAFVARLEAATRKLVVGPGLSPGTDVGPSVSEAQLNKVLYYHAVAREERAHCVIGGSRLVDGEHPYGYFSAPTIYDRVDAKSRLAQEEIFGPVLSVLRVKDASTAFDVANSVAYGLSSSVFTRDVGRFMDYVDQVDSGIMHLNSATIGGEAHLPFGGVKATGIGPREMGQTAIEFFTEWKTVYLDGSGQRRETKIY